MLLELAGVRTHVVHDPPIGRVSGPAAVLCSGLAGNWFDWDQCAEQISLERSVIRLDRPGYGLSDPWPDGVVPTLEAEVTRLHDLVERLDAGPVVLCGHSMASFYVEAFARRHPELVAGLVILDGSIAKSPRPTLPSSLRDDLLIRSADLAEGVGLNRVGGTAHRLLVQSEPPGGYTPSQRAWQDELLSSARYMRAAMLENGQYPVIMRELLDLREAEHLPDGLPITVAAADTGRTTPWGAIWLGQQRDYAKTLRARFAVVAPSGHHAMIDQPAQVAALVLDVLSPRAADSDPQE